MLGDSRLLHPSVRVPRSVFQTVDVRDGDVCDVRVHTNYRAHTVSFELFVALIRWPLEQPRKIEHPRGYQVHGRRAAVSQEREYCERMESPCSAALSRVCVSFSFSFSLSLCPTIPSSNWSRSFANSFLVRTTLARNSRGTFPQGVCSRRVVTPGVTLRLVRFLVRNQSPYLAARPSSTRGCSNNNIRKLSPGPR